jgi:arginyl-tRNA--protein-N-Asp/Glu arginylyltransferase
MNACLGVYGKAKHNRKYGDELLEGDKTTDTSTPVTVFTNEVLPTKQFRHQHYILYRPKPVRNGTTETVSIAFF